MAERDDDLDDVLGALPDAPADWVASAIDIPLLMQAAEVRAGDDEASLRQALVAVGLEPDARRLRALARIVGRDEPSC